MRPLGTRAVCGLLSLQRLCNRVILFGRCCCLLSVFVCGRFAIVPGTRGLRLYSCCFALRRWCPSSQLSRVASLGRWVGCCVVGTCFPCAFNSSRSAMAFCMACCCWYFCHAISTGFGSVFISHAQSCGVLQCCHHLNLL